NVTFLFSEVRLMKRRAFSIAAVALALIGGGLIWVQAADETIDMVKASGIRQRLQKGETVTPEEKAYLEYIQKAMKREADEARNAGPSRAPPATDSTGLIPLTDLGTQTYKGEDGGLYGGGSNEPPPEHRAAARRALEQIRPLDQGGRPSDSGKIVFLSIGMSN